MCLDVPEISLSTFSSQGLMLSSTAGNIEEDWEGFEASVVLCAIEMQVALMCQDVQAGGKEQRNV